MNVGVIGGTFDPIHNGHLAIAKAALEEYKLDKLIFMPAGDPYFKEGSNVSAPSVRLELTQIGTKEYSEQFECSDFEVKDPNKTFSAITFQRLRELHPEDTFFFIVGLDSLRNMRSWYRPELLFQNTIILCAARNDELGKGYQIFSVINELKEVYSDCDPDIRIIHTPMIDLSSTLIREAVKNGEDISAYVPEGVAAYIKAHKLYLDRDDSKKNNYH